MRICITLDDVLRAKTVQIGRMYEKHVNPDIDLDMLEFDTNDYKEIFGFEDTDAWQKFLYEDYVYEIFGEAPMTSKGVNLELNKWLLNIDDDEELKEKFEVALANPFEFNASIGFTCFFLSRAAVRAREFFFPENSSDIWSKCDVLVTADPKLISEKPNGKTCIKIDMPYNYELEADYTYDTLSDFLNDKEILNNLLDNSKKD